MSVDYSRLADWICRRATVDGDSAPDSEAANAAAVIVALVAMHAPVATDPRSPPPAAVLARASLRYLASFWCQDPDYPDDWRLGDALVAHTRGRR